MIKARIRGSKKDSGVVAIYVKLFAKVKAAKGVAAKEAYLTYSSRQFVDVIGAAKEVPKGDNILHHATVSASGDKEFVVVGSTKTIGEIVPECAKWGKKEGEGPGTFPAVTNPDQPVTNKNQLEASFSKEKPESYLKNIQAALGAGEDKQDGKKPALHTEAELVEIAGYQAMVNKVVQSEEAGRKRLTDAAASMLKDEHLMMCNNPDECIIQVNINTQAALQASKGPGVSQSLVSPSRQDATLGASQTTPPGLGAGGEDHQSSPGPGVPAVKEVRVEIPLAEMITNTSKYYPQLPPRIGKLFAYIAHVNQPAGSSTISVPPLVGEVCQEIDGFKGVGPVHLQGWGQCYLSGDQVKKPNDFKKLSRAVAIFTAGVLQIHALPQGRFTLICFLDSPDTVIEDYGYPTSWPAEGTEIRTMIDRIGILFCRWLRRDGKNYKDHPLFQNFVKELQLAWREAMPGAVYGGEMLTFPDTYRAIRTHVLAADAHLCELIIAEVKHRKDEDGQTLETSMSKLPHRAALRLLGSSFGTVLEAEAVAGAKTSIANVKVAVPDWGGAYCELLRDAFRREKEQDTVILSKPEGQRQKRGHGQGEADDGYTSESSGEATRQVHSRGRRAAQREAKEKEKQKQKRDQRAREKQRANNKPRTMSEEAYIKCGWTKSQLTGEGAGLRVTGEAWHDEKNYPFRKATEQVRGKK